MTGLKPLFINNIEESEGLIFSLIGKMYIPIIKERREEKMNAYLGNCKFKGLLK